MHGYYSSCAFMYNFTPIDIGVFLVKMCKMKCFCILQDFAMDALKHGKVLLKHFT